MEDQKRSKKQLIKELAEMRQRIAEVDGINHKLINHITAILNNVYLLKRNIDHGSKAFILLERTEKAIMKTLDLT
jgi:hypothetical protein